MEDNNCFVIYSNNKRIIELVSKILKRKIFCVTKVRSREEEYKLIVYRDILASSSSEDFINILTKSLKEKGIILSISSCLPTSDSFQILYAD